MKVWKVFAIIIVALSLFVIIRISFGVYHHDEFAETHLFLKHRPTWKWSFYSPIGMSNLKLENLNEDERKEQILFDEFVSSKGMSK